MPTTNKTNLITKLAKSGWSLERTQAFFAARRRRTKGAFGPAGAVRDYAYHQRIAKAAR